jgi:uncharacterized protein YerC
LHLTVWITDVILGGEYAVRRGWGVIKSLKLYVLLPLILAGAFAGLFVYNTMLARYVARITLPVNSNTGIALSSKSVGEAMMEFRAIEPELRSIEQFRRFGIARNLTDNPTFQLIERQIVRGSPQGGIRIEHVPRLLKKDGKDLPDSVARDILATKEQIKFDFQALATAVNADVALRQAQLSMDFFRDVAISSNIKAMMEVWSIGAQIETATLREQMTNTRLELASIERRFASMDAIQRKYKNIGEAIEPSLSRTQIQTTGQRNLSPLQQLIALETDRVDTTDILMRFEDKLVELQTMSKFAAEFSPVISVAQPADKLARQMLERVRTLQSPRQGPTSNALAADKALVGIEQYLTKLIAQYAETKTALPEGLIERPQPWWGAIAALLGGVIGMIVWMLSVFPRVIGAIKERVSHQLGLPVRLRA